MVYLLTPAELRATELEELVPGLTFQWLFDRQGMAFYAQHTSRELVDAWFNRIVTINSTWPEDRYLFILNDFSGKDCVTTPYNQHKNRELMRMFPNRRTASAIVVKQNLTMQLSRLFIRALPSSKSIYLTFSRDDGLIWLKKQIELYK